MKAWKALSCRRRRPGRQARPQAPPYQPRLERLEGRCVPAAFLVSTAADEGPGSLRVALAEADTDPGPSTITFDPSLNGQTITATSGPLPAITASGLTIQGPGPDALTIAGADNGSVLTVGPGVSGVTISGLGITGGGSGPGGFGIRSGGGINNAGTLALVGCAVAGNGVFSEGFSASGGGIENSGTMTITDCAISGNSVSGKTGAAGGGIDNRGQMTVVDSTVSGNLAFSIFSSAAGGGISNSGTLALFRCTFSGNQVRPSVQAAGSGGGIATLSSSVTTVIDCTVAGNSSVSGGGVQVLGGGLALASCTVAENVGGGITVNSSGAFPVRLANAIVAWNQFLPDIGGAVQSEGDNLVGGPGGAAGLLPGDRTGIDPLLGPLQFNGGPTPTLALLPTSPAIDAGNSAAPGLPATDQRGLHRVVNGAADIGAFEYQPPGTTRTLTAAPNSSVLGRPVTLTATVTGAAPGSNVPTGFIDFSCRGVTLGTADLSGGSATLTTAGLPLGEDLVAAVYSGDANFTGFQSASVTVLVSPPPPAAAGVFDPLTATWYLRSGASAGPPDAGQFAYGPAGSVPVVGDWSGSGQTGIGVFDRQAFTWYLRNEASAGLPDAGAFQYGGVGALPVAGDWSGSGHAGIGVFDPSTATWYLRNEPSAGAPDAGVFQYGFAGAISVVGDWAGTGHVGIGVFDPRTYTWYLRSSATPGAPDVGVFQYGGAGWLPVAGDWSGSGHAGIGVFDPGSGAWYLRSEANAGAPDAGVFAYGAAGWLPVAGPWRPPAQPLPTQGGEGAGAAGVGPALVGGLASVAYGLMELPGSSAAGKEDLLTAVLHEMGHLAGSPDGGTGLMAGALAPGTRDLGALDAVFARPAP
jgi:hypothetical protein